MTSRLANGLASRRTAHASWDPLNFLCYTHLAVLAMKAVKGTLLSWCVLCEMSQLRPLPYTSSYPHSDAACKQLILQLNDTSTHKFVIEDLDETHLLVAPSRVDELRVLLEAEVSLKWHRYRANDELTEACV